MDNIELNYTHIINKDSSQTILFLHGWGCNGNIFKQYVENLQDKFNIVVLDLYGFGQSIDPKPFFDVYEYAIQVYLLLKKINISEVSIIAHSFGGRIAIILATLFDIKINKMILTGCAGLKPKYSLQYYIKVYLYKTFKKIGIRLNTGSTDLKTSNRIMKLIMVKVVNQHLDYLIKRINCRTFLIWGKKDKSTPLYMFKKLDKNLRSSESFIIKSGEHFCLFTHIYLCINKVREFLLLC